MIKKRKLGIVVALLTGIAGFFALQQALAATGTIRLAPSSASVEKDKNITVDIRIDPGTAVDGVESTISYDTNKLQFVSINASGSAFPIELQQTGGSGSVQVTRGHLTGTVSANNSLVAKVTFKARVGGTTASLSLSGNSTAAGSYQDPSTQGATLTLTSPPAPAPEPEPEPEPTPAPSPSGGSGGSGSNSSGDTPTSNENDSSSEGGGDTPAPEPTQPNEPKETASGKTIQLVELLFKRVRFKVTGEQPFKVYVKYGMGEQLNLSTEVSALSNEHEVTLDEESLIPGTTYSYVVVTEDASGKTEESEVQTIKTKGYPVHVRVLGENSQPIKNQLVRLYSEPMTARTNDEGLAVFEDVAPGSHRLEYTQGDKKFSQTIQVADVAASAAIETVDPQVFSVVFSEAATSSLPAGVLVALIVLPVLAVLGFVFRSKLAFITDRFNSGGPTWSSPTGGTGSPPGTVSGGEGSVQSPSSSELDEMLGKVQGSEQSKPGTLVSPKDEGDQRL